MADRKANAVGPLRLSCQSSGLRIDLLCVGRYLTGFAFAPATEAMSFTVPYTAVRGLTRQGKMVYLSLDPRVSFPYSRFALARFTRDASPALMRAFRQRQLFSGLSYPLPLIMGAGAGYAYAQSLAAAGAVGIAAVATVVAWLSWRLLRALVDGLSWGGPTSDRLAEELLERVSARLGLEPALELGSGRSVERKVARPVAVSEVVGAHRMRPRAFALVAGFAVIASLGAALVVKRYGVAAEVLLPVDIARHGLLSPVPRMVSSAVAEGTPKHAGCRCQQRQRPPWASTTPQISVLVTPQRGNFGRMDLPIGGSYGISFADNDPRERVEMQLSVVNNSARTLETVDLVLTFARRDEAGKRGEIRERGLHWPGRLRPGETVKWSVSARGSEVRVDSQHRRLIGQRSLKAASASRFKALAEAKLSVVRVHAATMMSLMGAPGAASFAEGLQALNPMEEARRQALLRLSSPLAACDVTAVGDEVEVCVFNGSARLQRQLAIRPTSLPAAQGQILNDLFLPGKGLQFRLPIAPALAAQGLVVESAPSGSRVTEP